MFFVSITVGNLYRWTGSGEEAYMNAVRAFAVSVTLLMTLYCILWLVRRPGFLSLGFLGFSVLALWQIGELVPDLTSYDVQLKLLIWVEKIVTAAAAVAVYLSFSARYVFERSCWAILAALEVYSSVQYPFCKIAPGGSLDPSLWVAWGDQAAKSACSRAFGQVMAPKMAFGLSYIEVGICAALMAWVIWRWRDAGKSLRQDPD